MFYTEDELESGLDLFIEGKDSGIEPIESVVEKKHTIELTQSELDLVLNILNFMNYQTSERKFSAVQKKLLEARKSALTADDFDDDIPF